MVEMKAKSKDANYYDLIRVPHGHIPAPLVNFWSKFPIPVKETRGCDFYYCPRCGEPSFFKIEFACWQCQDDIEEFGAWKLYKELQRKYQRRKRRKYFRNFWKRLEYLCLPVLVLLGKAWYVKSNRLRRPWYGDC